MGTLKAGKWWILGITSVLIVGAIGVFYEYQKITKDPVSARRMNAPIPVKVQSVGEKDISYSIGAASTSREYTTLSLIAKIEAPVRSVTADVGDIVKKGQVLMEFDGTVLQSEFQSARTRLNKARVTHANSKLALERVKELYDQKLIARPELEKAQEDYSAAQAEFEEATYNLECVKKDMSFIKVTSPIQGIILERVVNPGESPALKQPLFKIGLIDPISVIAHVPEQNFPDVSLGQTAEIVLDAYPNTTFEGQVYKIDPNVNTETRVFQVYIKISNQGLILKPGLTGFSRISFNKKSLAVPNLAIINPTGQRATVFTVDKENVAHLKQVQIGHADEKYTEVLAGLEDGEKIVAISMRGLRDKDKVMVWEKVF